MSTKPKTRLNNEDIKRLAQSYIEDASSNTEIQTHREQALRFFFGEPYGDETPDNSQVVSTELRDSIEWAVPNITDTFLSTDRVVEFLPRNPQDNIEAEAQTDYANFIFRVENRGDIVLEQMVRDSLLARLGVVKVYWDEWEEREPEQQHFGLPEDLFIEMTSPDDIEVVEHTEHEIDIPPEIPQLVGQISQMAPELGGNPDIIPPSVKTHDITIQKKVRRGTVRLENIPPSDFIVTSDAKWDLRTGGIEAKCQGHRAKITVADCLDMGFSWEDLERAATAEGFDNENDIKSRYGDTNLSETDDPLTRKVWVSELYFRGDKNGDGYPELLQVFVLGEKGDGALLSAEEWDLPPYAGITPILIPHKLHGIDFHDLIGEVQHTKSTILREVLYNLYLSNRPRKKYKEGNVDVAELLDHTPGGVIACKGEPSSDIQEDTVSFVAGQSMGVLQYLDEVIEARTGVGKGLPSLDPKFLQSTSPSVVGAYETASQKKLKQIVRVASALGIRYMFMLIKHLLKKHQDYETTYMLNAEYRSVDPSEWGDNDVVINVIPTAIDKNSRLANLNAMAQRIEGAMQTYGFQNPIMGLQQYYHCIRQIVSMAEIGNPDQFINNPNKIPPEALAGDENKPDPEIVKLQQEMALKQQELQMKLQLQREEAIARIQLDRQKAMADALLRKEELGAEIDLKTLEAVFNMEQKKQDMGLKAAEKVVNLSTNIRNPMR